MKSLIIVLFLSIIQLSFSQSIDKNNFNHNQYPIIIGLEAEFNNSDNFLKELKTINTSIYGNYKLDSITANSVQNINNLDVPSKTNYIFDNSGNLLIIHIKILENDNWVNYWRYNYTYNENNDFIITTNEVWENESWILNYEYSYTYDSNGNKTLNIEKRRVNGVFSNYSKRIYTYDGDFNKVEYLNNKWENETWVNYSRSTWDYDEENNRTLYLNEHWENNDWVNNLRSHYYYNNNGSNSIDSIYGEIWNYNLWTNSSTEVNVYDENNNWLHHLQQHFNPYSSRELNLEYDINNNQIHWVELRQISTHELKEECTNNYNENGQLQYTIKENSSNGDWVSSISSTYYFNENTNVTERHGETLINNVWENSTRNIWNYDDFGNVILSESFKWEDGSWLQNADDYFRITYNNGSNNFLIKAYKVEAYYSEATAVEELQDKNITGFYCSPIPATNQTIINLNLIEKINADICLLDITGKKLKTIYKGNITQGKHKYKLLTEYLESGLYFISISYEGKTRTSKLIINR